MKKLLLLSFCMILFYSYSNAQIAVIVVEPPSISGNYDFTWGDPGGGWGTADLLDPLNSVQDTIMLVDDGTSADSLGCNPLVNDLTGKIAVVYRLTCEFGTKAFNAQIAGAVGVIIINWDVGGPVGMNGGTDGPNVTIPVVMISKDDGAILRAEMDAGTTVVVFIGNKAGLYINDLGMAAKDVLMARATGNPILVSLGAAEFDVPMGAWVYNYGSDAQTNVTLTAEFTGADNFSITSAPVASIADSAYISLPTYSAAFYSGLYNVNFTISADSVDNFPGDNTFYSNFLIDSLISYAKIDTATLMPVSSAHYSLTTPPAVYENCIHFRDPNASRLSAMGIYCSASGGAGGTMVGELIEARVYEWNDVFTGLSDPGFPASPWALNQVVSKFYTYAADLQNEMIYIAFDDSLILADDQRYLFCAITYNAPDVYMGFDTYYDYDEVLNNNDQPVSIVITDADQFAIGFGTDVTSSVSVRVVAAPSTVSLLNVFISATSNDFCDPACVGWATVLPVLGIPPYTYLWDDPGTQTTVTATGLCNGTTYSIIVTDSTGAVDTATVTFVPPSTPPSFTLSATSTVICNGDSNWITASSVPQGIYAWSTGDTTQTIGVDSVGTYTISVTNCAGVSYDTITIITLTAPPTFTISATQSIMCPGDTSVLTVSSVSQGIYIWSTGDTAQSTSVTDTGTYWVAVSNCGGVDTGSTSITLPSPPVATVTGNVDFCYGDTITLTAGTEPSASYVWTTGESTQSIIVDTAMSITLTVTNCGGSSNTTVSTKFVSVPTVFIDVSDTTVICGDGGLTKITLYAFASGDPPFTYAWSNTATTQKIDLTTSSESGDYYVTVYNVCGDSVRSDTTTITIHPQITVAVASITEASTSTSNDGGITTAVTGGVQPFTYEWSPTSAIGPDPSGLANGGYTLTLTDANSCVATVSTNVPVAVGISEPEFGSFSIHPNPNNGQFTIDLVNLSNEEYVIMVRNIIGQVIFSEIIVGNTVDRIHLDLTGRETGIYLLTISNSYGTRTEKLIVY